MDEGDGGEGQAGEQEENPRGRSLSSVFIIPYLNSYQHRHCVLHSYTHFFINFAKAGKERGQNQNNRSPTFEPECVAGKFDCPYQVLLDNQHDHPCLYNDCHPAHVFCTNNGMKTKTFFLQGPFAILVIGVTLGFTILLMELTIGKVNAHSFNE